MGNHLFSKLTPHTIEQLDHAAVNFQLGNMGLKQKDLEQLFLESEMKLEEETKNKNKAQNLALEKNQELSVEEKEFVDKYASLDYNFKNTLKFLLKEKGHTNFTELKQPIEFLQQQKDLVKRLRDILQQNLSDLLEKNENQNTIKKLNDLIIKYNVLLTIQNEYIRDTQTKLLSVLNYKK